MVDLLVLSNSTVMPRLGLGIHEFRGGKLVDAKPKAWHDDRMGGTSGAQP
jgi:hypothetical protein